MKRLGFALIAASVAAVLAGGGFAASIYRGLRTPADPGAEPISLRIEGGETLGSVFTRMHRLGLLRDAGTGRWLARYARLRGLDREVKRGEYELVASRSPLELLDAIVAGQPKVHAVTLPEGLRSDEIADRLAASQIAPTDRLLELARDAAFARSLGIEADSLEGYLYPETYHFERGADPAAVLRRMVEELHARLRPEDLERIEASPLTLHEVITLASIVEKETGAPEERARIAAVFHNRLRNGMRLQSDPTVIYGILASGREFDGNIRRVDLETDTPYNTYTRRGIPPGPIASPGIDAIRAVLEPEDVDYLYFVSRNDGTHVFSSRHRDHVAAVNRYQRGR